MMKKLVVSIMAVLVIGLNFTFVSSASAAEEHKYLGYTKTTVWSSEIHRPLVNGAYRDCTINVYYYQDWESCLNHANEHRVVNSTWRYYTTTHSLSHN